MFHWQQSLPAASRVPLLLFPENDISGSYDVFARWQQEHQPDEVISFDTHVPGWLKRMGLRVPDDIGFVVHDWTPQMTEFAGIYQRRDHLAAAAVDLVVTQLSQHEHGVPLVPRQIIIPPQDGWAECEGQIKQFLAGLMLIFYTSETEPKLASVASPSRIAAL